MCHTAITIKNSKPLTPVKTLEEFWKPRTGQFQQGIVQINTHGIWSRQPTEKKWHPVAIKITDQILIGNWIQQYNIGGPHEIIQAIAPQLGIHYYPIVTGNDSESGWTQPDQPPNQLWAIRLALETDPENQWKIALDILDEIGTQCPLGLVLSQDCIEKSRGMENLRLCPKPKDRINWLRLVEKHLTPIGYTLQPHTLAFLL